ncbi:MAG: hypothetical protein QOJ61_3499 [Mycobacterium sp.]|nr:hypothetical protein [Mycobacterium sp.]
MPALTLPMDSPTGTESGSMRIVENRRQSVELARRRVSPSGQNRVALNAARGQF